MNSLDQNLVGGGTNGKCAADMITGAGCQALQADREGHGLKATVAISRGKAYALEQL